MNQDYCDKCSVRGDVKTCESTPCSQRDGMWYIQSLKEKIQALERPVIALHVRESSFVASDVAAY